MRSLLLLSPLLAVFLSALVPHAVAVGAAETPIRRFAFKGTPVSRSGPLSDAEIYARSLTRRRPTRRSTAERRQASDQPVVTHDVTVGATNAATGSPVGNLNYAEQGIILTDDPGMTLTTDYSPSWAGRADRRINIADSYFSAYPILGFVQYGSEGGLTLGPGSANGVLLTGIASPGTGPGDTPASLNNYVYSSDEQSETDLWSIDYSTGAMTANWVNPDGTTPTVVLITDGYNVIATGDYEAFNLANDPVGEWYQITLTYAASS